MGIVRLTSKDVLPRAPIDLFVLTGGIFGLSRSNVGGGRNGGITGFKVSSCRFIACAFKPYKTGLKKIEMNIRYLQLTFRLGKVI